MLLEFIARVALFCNGNSTPYLSLFDLLTNSSSDTFPIVSLFAKLKLIFKLLNIIT